MTSFPDARRRLRAQAPRSGAGGQRLLHRSIAVGIVAVNALVIIYLWLHDGGITGVHNTSEALTSIGRITGLLGAYALLIQVLLLARLRWLERLVGFDKLTIWHRINGKLCLYLILAHVGFVTVGYTLADRISLPTEISTLLTQYPGMVDATLGTALLILVVVTSLVVVRMRLRYEWWYLVHLTSYAAIVFAWFHQLPTGNDFILNLWAARYWTALYLATLALVVLFRLTLPIYDAFRYQLKVAEVNDETSGVVSLRLTGRNLERMRAQAGQFFLWRFLTLKLMWESHPFSLSAAPDSQSLRITVKNLGDFTSRMGQMRPGTRVVGVGPFGLFTDAERRRDRVALIAGGVGITPIRALLEQMSGDVALVYRVNSEAEIVFRDELDELCRERGITVHYVVGHHRDPGAERLLSPEHLRELIPDIAGREIYVCGPPALSDLVVANVRKAGVPSKYIHSEAFAFSPAPSRTSGSSRARTRARLSILGLCLAAGAAVLGRVAWIATHAAPTVSGAAAIPTVKPTSVAAAQPTAAAVKPTTVAKATPAAVKKATAVPTARPSAVTYTGSAVSTDYGPIQVTVVVSKGKIEAVTVSASPDSARSQALEAQAIPVLKSETLQAQSARINTVSGATTFSDAYISSLQSALSKAGL